MSRQRNVPKGFPNVQTVTYSRQGDSLEIVCPQIPMSFKQFQYMVLQNYSIYCTGQPTAGGYDFLHGLEVEWDYSGLSAVIHNAASPHEAFTDSSGRICFQKHPNVGTSLRSPRRRCDNSFAHVDGAIASVLVAVDLSERGCGFPPNLQNSSPCLGSNDIISLHINAFFDIAGNVTSSEIEICSGLCSFSDDRINGDFGVKLEFEETQWPFVTDVFYDPTEDRCTAIIPIRLSIGAIVCDEGTPPNLCGCEEFYPLSYTIINVPAHCPPVVAIDNPECCFLKNYGCECAPVAFGQTTWSGDAMIVSIGYVFEGVCAFSLDAFAVGNVIWRRPEDFTNRGGIPEVPDLWA